MKSFFSILALAGSLANALPVESASNEVTIAGDKDARMSFFVRNELEDGSPSECPKAIFIYARGSVEPENMVRRQ